MGGIEVRPSAIRLPGRQKVLDAKVAGESLRFGANLFESTRGEHRVQVDLKPPGLQERDMPVKEIDQEESTVLQSSDEKERP